MNEVCIITTYKRDELLWLCIEAIRKQFAGIVWIFSDHGRQNPDLWRLSLRFGAQLFFARGQGYGNSSNLIGAMKTALVGPWEILHCVEDDTIIHPSYFDWARAMLSTKRYAAVCGHVGNELDTWYTSPCASWDAEHLRKCLKLVPPGYLEATTREEMQKILDECLTFKKSHYRYGSAEQDGYFLRCIEHFGWKTKFPEKPLAQHMGWWGYNRAGHKGPEGTFEERIAAVRKAINDKTFRTAMFGQRITQAEMEGM